MDTTTTTLFRNRMIEQSHYCDLARLPVRLPVVEVRVAYDKDLADRIRALLSAATAEPVTERQMFGGLAFMLGGHMFCGVVKDALMGRLGGGAGGGPRGQAPARPL